jgi:hypothetical protein
MRKKPAPCEFCGVYFKMVWKNARFCSRKCKGMALSKYPFGKTCPGCNTIFKNPNVAHQKYCSRECAGRSKAVTLTKLYDKVCRTCKKSFTTTSWSRFYCDDACFNRSPAHFRNQKDSYMRKRYGITIREYEQLYIKQKGTCAICHQKCSTGMNLAVDHCHDTKEVRGLLCTNCNTAIGSLKHDTGLLTNAIHYLGGDEAIDKIIDDNIIRYGDDRLL